LGAGRGDEAKDPGRESGAAVRIRNAGRMKASARLDVGLTRGAPSPADAFVCIIRGAMAQ
jgi:hypothetical protein